MLLREAVSAERTVEERVRRGAAGSLLRLTGGTAFVLILLVTLLALASVGRAEGFFRCSSRPVWQDVQATSLWAAPAWTLVMFEWQIVQLARSAAFAAVEYAPRESMAAASAVNIC